jgi:uncharacterized protein (TIGR03437 family)
MCRTDTIYTKRTVLPALVVCTLWCGVALAQVRTPAANAPGWRKLGNESVGLNLAGPAGGSVDVVWFSALGDRLYARTKSGLVFETTNFADWTLSKTAGTPPDPATRVQAPGGRYYALGRDVQVSEDNGSTFINLTDFKGSSIIGPNQHSLAVSPLDSRQIVVANDMGVWRSADAGMSWSSLNEELPNLPMRRLLPKGASGAIRAEVEGIGEVELPPAAAAAHANWIPVPPPKDPAAPQEESEPQLRAEQYLHTRLTAFAKSANTWFAGADDGRLWSSLDSGNSWYLSGYTAGGRIEALQTGGDTLNDSPRSALAVVALAPGAPANAARVVRVINAGSAWDDIGSSLPEGAIHGIAVDAAARIAYVAGDKGVFTAHVDLNSLEPVSSWELVPGLPQARAMDVRLDRVRNILYVALDGYGLYAAPSPHRLSAVRLLNAADQPAKAAAPGVLLHVQGSGLSQIRSEDAELAMVSSSSVSAQVQVPFEASGATLALTVDSSVGQSRLALPLQAVAPSILVDGDGLPILVDAASGLTLDARNLAHPGARVQVFAAGLGKVNPDWRAGIPAPEDPPVVLARVGATLNGVPVEVTRATLAPGYVGLYLVEVQLPGLLNAGAGDLSLQVNGEESNHVKILVEQ